MTGFEVYKEYIRVKLHFEQIDYDYFKFSGSNINLDTYRKRFDMSTFERLAQNIPSKNVTDIFLAVTLANKKYTSLIYHEIKELYDNYMDRQKKISNDLEVCLNEIENICLKTKKPIENYFINSENNKHSDFFKKYYSGQISAEIFLLLDEYMELIEIYDEKYGSDAIWQKCSFQLKKYSPFMKERKINKERVRNIILEFIDRI